MSAMLKALVDDLGGVDKVARTAGVHVSTVRRWLRAAPPIPKASYQALLAASSWGRADRAVMAYNERRTYLACIEAQRREIEQLRHTLARLCALADTGAANWPVYSFGGSALNTATAPATAATALATA
jgi:hypothetical protein